MHYDEHYSTKFNAKKKCSSDFAELMFTNFDLMISFHSMVIYNNQKDRQNNP